MGKMFEDLKEGLNDAINDVKTSKNKYAYINDEIRKKDDKFMIAAKKILKRYHKEFEELAK